VRKGDDITTLIVLKVEKIRSLNLLEPPWATTACRGTPLSLVAVVVVVVVVVVAEMKLLENAVLEFR
jgi:hypothetical protein